MRRSLLLLLILSFLCVPWYAYNQLPPVQHFTTENGLPSNIVYSVSRDFRGYIWLATDKGISRYNGTKFENFTTLDGIPDNEVFSVLTDYEDRLWLLSYNGELCFLKDNIFHTAANTPWLRLPLKEPMFRAFLQKDSSINIILYAQGHFANIKHNKIQLIKLPTGDYDIIYILNLPNKKYRVFCHELTLDIDDNGEVLSKAQYPSGQQYLTFNYDNNHELKLLGQDGVYSTTGQKLFRFDKNKIDLHYAVGAYSNATGSFVGLLNGLLIDDSTLIQIGEHVTTIINDDNGNFWFSTRGKGVYKISKNFRKIIEYKKQYKNQILYAKVIGDKLFYVNTDGNLYEFRNGASSLILENPVPSNANKAYFTRSNFLIDDYGNFFQFHSTYNIMVSGLITGRIKIKITDGQIKEAVKNVLSNNKYIFNLRPNYSLTRYLYADFFKPGIPRGKIMILPDELKSSRIFAHAINPADSTLWLSLSKGMYLLRDTMYSKQQYMPQTHFRQLSFLDRALVGIAGGNHLLICHDFNNNLLQIDTVKVDDYVWEYLYPIDQNRCIVTSNKLYKLLTVHPPSPDKATKYTVQTLENSFIPREAEYIATGHDYCYFFKEGTITRVATSVLFEINTPPKPIFRTLNTKKKTYAVKPEIIINYDESPNISLLFDNISFAGGDVITEYSIAEKGEDNWRIIAGNEINLNKPGFGNFTIKIRSKTPSSRYSDPAIIRLIIEKPFWAEWWFLLCCSLLLIAFCSLVLHFFTRRHLRKKQKEHDAERKYQQAEYKALNALMNPHFIFNSLNNIQGLVNKNEKRIANEYLVIFSELIRQNMHNISKGFISLQDEINLVQNYLNLEKLRFKEYINFEIILDDELDIELILIPPLMIQPLVENAIKHGLLPKQSEFNKVTIKIYEEKNLLNIEIEDNGVGLTHAQLNHSNLHESYGLANLQKRADYLNRIQKQKIELKIEELVDGHGEILGTRAKISMELDGDNSEFSSGSSVNNRP